MKQAYLKKGKLKFDQFFQGKIFELLDIQDDNDDQLSYNFLDVAHDCFGLY